MTFTIVRLKKSIPFVLKAIPEIKVEGKWLSAYVEESIQALHQTGFAVRAVVIDNHAPNVSVYSDLFGKFGSSFSENIIAHPSKADSRIYLLYDSVHLLKNICNNLLYAGRFIFPPFEFNNFLDKASLPGGEISWKLLNDVFYKDEFLQSNLRKANKLTYKVLHPGDSKQSFPLVLAIFDATTLAAIKSYFPDRVDTANFLKLINCWWMISNSKTKYHTNFRIGNAVMPNDMKPIFWRKLTE